MGPASAAENLRSKDPIQWSKGRTARTSKLLNLRFAKYGYVSPKIALADQANAADAIAMYEEMIQREQYTQAEALDLIQNFAKYGADATDAWFMYKLLIQNGRTQANALVEIHDNF